MEATKEMRPRSPSHGVVCQNPHCGYYLQSEGKDIIRRGRNSAGHQRFQCRHCGARFVETRGTPLCQRRLSTVEAARICRLVASGKGIRQIERLIGRHRETVEGLITDIAGNREAGIRYLTRILNFREKEVNDFLSAVSYLNRKKQISSSIVQSDSTEKGG